MASNESLRELFQSIREMIAANDLDAALPLICDLAFNVSRQLADEALLLRGRHAGFCDQERRGGHSPGELRRERTQLQQAALGLVTVLEQRVPQNAGPVPPVAAQAAAKLPAESWQSSPLEQILGVNNLKQIAWIEQGVEVSRAVCRIRTPRGVGTGFLVGPGLLLTNNHVIPTAEVASQAKAEFNYQHSFPAAGPPANSVRYCFDPLARFITDPVNSLDFTLVGVCAEPEHPPGPAVNSWGCLQLNPTADPVPGEHVVIIQHPNGQTKQIALTANNVLQVKHPLLHYSTDTMPGSSGSPVFNDLWQVVAIHHSAGPPVPTSQGTRYSNEGILMSAIREKLQNFWPQ